MKLRHVNESDRDNILKWRNAPNVRAAMINQREISNRDHKKWWKITRENRNKHLLVLEIKDLPIAIINFFDVKEDKSEGWWGFYLTEHAEGQGILTFWNYVEAIALRYAFEVLRLQRLLCETRSTNVQVLLLHERYGFEKIAASTSDNAISHDLIVKEISFEKFLHIKDKILPVDIKRIQLPALIEENKGEKMRLVIIGSANWDEISFDLSQRFYEYAGLEFQCYTPPFGQGFLQLSDPDSQLRMDPPDYVVFAERFEDLVHTYETIGKSNIKEIEDRFDQYIESIKTFRRSSVGQFLIHDLSLTHPSFNQFSYSTAKETTLTKILEKFNTKLLELSQTLPDTTLLPVSKVIRDIGRNAAYPSKYWLLGRFPFGPKFTEKYHKMLVGTVMAINGLTARALVLDLDNTLWGGVVGDDGKFGIQLGTDFPGNQFVEFQHFIKLLSDQGFILTVCSKNTEEVALEAITENPNMVVKLDDLVSHRINWSPKSENIKAISQELGLGLGSLMFIDDNPMEREEVRQNCPDVIVPEMPVDVADWSTYLIEHPALTRLGVTKSDKEKVRQYKIRAQIKEEEKNASDRYSFLRKLNMKIGVEVLNEENNQRAIQLFTKTNQFNTTTKRYSETELRSAISSGCEVLTIRIQDKFGSDEIIAAVVLSYYADATVMIDNFVMSCRVMGRGVETAILASICERAVRRNCKYLTGYIIETKRNEPCRKLYADHGFIEKAEKYFSLDLKDPVPFPDWFEYILE